MDILKDKQIVLIKWYDAKFSPGTYDEKAILGHRMALFESVGYLIARDEVTTAIASEQNDQKEFRDITLIPSGSIISVGTLIASPSV